MSYSVDPPQLIGLAERMRRAFDDLAESVAALHRDADSVALALARAAPAHSAFVELATARIDLARRIVARGRGALSALQTAVLAYVTADEEMTRDTVAAARSITVPPNPFDPVVFGRRRL